MVSSRDPVNAFTTTTLATAVASKVITLDPQFGRRGIVVDSRRFLLQQSPARENLIYALAHCQLVCFMGTDTNGLGQLGDENVTIINRIGAGRLENGCGDGTG